ncbi:MAG: EscU/YscU/HrcU family type III secretion system export apparatus switch protein [Armatimonadetes bacterium]|nr:EscU/YscU/HrcU family type III secretion system export apparatus switch protein [Armatimonadota bacterium]
MSDEGLYEPTEWHLRRLREQGRGPHSGAARGAAVLAAACLLVWAGVTLLSRFLTTSLPLAGVDSSAKAAQLLAKVARVWSLVALLAAGLVVIMAFAAWATDALLAGVAHQRRSLVLRAPLRFAALWTWLVSSLLGLVALAMGCVWLWRVVVANPADPPQFAIAFTRSAAVAIGAIALGLAVLDAAVARAGFISSARMTREQFLEEQKETSPPPMVVLRRAPRMRRRR